MLWRPSTIKQLMLAPIVAGLSIVGCASSPEPNPAVLEASDDKTIAALKQQLGASLDRARIELGPGDLTQQSTISVLPPPLSPAETASPVTPTLFDLVLENETCVAVQRETGERIVLEGIRCRPA